MSDTNNETVKVWDILVRVFHWSLVVFFVLAYITGESDEELHVIAGYVVLGLISFRVVWGFIGSRYARFSEFVTGRQQVKQYLKGFMRAEPEHYYGHNPAAGWSVIFMLVMLALISYSGLELLASEGEGPLATEISLVQPAFADGGADEADHDDDEASEESWQHEFWEELHEILVNIMLLFVLFHIASVLISSGLHEENLTKAMITGRKKKVPPQE